MRGTPKSIGYSREWENPRGGKIHYFKIEWENGDRGEFSSAEREQKKFEVGKEVEYTVEVKTNKSGSYNFYNIVRESFKGGGRRWSVETAKRIRNTNLLRNSMILAVGMNSKSEVYLKPLDELEMEICGMLEEDNDEKRTSFQSALNAVVETVKVKLYCDANYKYTPEDICKNIQQFYNYVTK